ncbi:haloacid dehalogenase-like hydrolase (HAD) superfamily protein isoform X1 [Carex rostrata]
MLNRRVILLSRYLLRNCGSSPLMAVNGTLAPAIFCGFSHLSEANERCLIQNRISFDMGIGSGLNLKYGLSIRRDQIQKSCAVARYKQPINGSELFLVKNSDPNCHVNGSGECGNGKPLGFPGNPNQEKLVVAVDVDEVLGSFLSALNKFIADRCSWNHSVSEYHVYEFFKIWKCSRSEADILVHEFFKTHYFQDGIHPIPGALSALQHLSSFCSLSVVTSRQNAIKDHTLEWLEKHYPGLFEEIHFGNHFALDGQSKPKSEICRSLGAKFLIDDNPRYALECAEVGIKVLLFDYHNSYPWCKTGVAESHPLVTKVHNWQEVEQKLTSLVISEC